MQAAAAQAVSIRDVVGWRARCNRGRPEVDNETR
jgi:hypothetical protein